MSTNHEASRSRNGQRRPNRAGAAAVELALLLPLLMFVFAAGTDWCRIYYATHTLEECARSGALAASGLAYQERGLSTSDRESRARTEAIKDGANLRPPLQVANVTVNTAGNYVTVTVAYQFNTIASVPGVVGPWNVSRVVRMPIQP